MQKKSTILEMVELKENKVLEENVLGLLTMIVGAWIGQQANVKIQVNKAMKIMQDKDPSLYQQFNQLNNQIDKIINFAKTNIKKLSKTNDDNTKKQILTQTKNMMTQHLNSANTIENKLLNASNEKGKGKYRFIAATTLNKIQKKTTSIINQCDKKLLKLNK